VVGADGRHSTIARLTGVEEYLGFDMTRGGYWFYWPEPAAWKTDAYPYDALIAHVGEDMLIVFQCDGGLLVIAVVPPQGVARSWGGDYRQRYIDWLERCPLSAPLVRGNAPVGKGNGIVKARFFFRRPVGEGFALVGDAGLFMDYVTGQGMTDALYGGRDLATAILDGRPEAMQWYWRNRDATTLPLYYDAIRQGEVGINNGFGRMLYQRLGRDPEMSSRIARISDRQILPSQLVDPRTLARWTLSSVVRGPRGALRPFLRLGARVKKERQELARRRALLADAEKALRDAPPAARERHDSDVGAIDALAGE
jgi:2-polyprenyl-6-methoxyphenol hydroxylase-like FAD-dependent oxidoreductase